MSGAPGCKLTYRVVITGPLSTGAARLAAIGVDMMANALGLNTFYGDVTCAAYENSLPFCTYWRAAKMCYGYPWQSLEPYVCTFE
jgi:hypothetical protein